MMWKTAIKKLAIQPMIVKVLLFAGIGKKILAKPAKPHIIIRIGSL